MQLFDLLFGRELVLVVLKAFLLLRLHLLSAATQLQLSLFHLLKLMEMQDNKLMLCLLLKNQAPQQLLTTHSMLSIQTQKKVKLLMLLCIAKEVNLKQTTSNCRLLTELSSYSYLTLSLENFTQSF